MKRVRISIFGVVCLMMFMSSWVKSILEEGEDERFLNAAF